MLGYFRTRRSLLTALVAIIAGYVSATFMEQGNALVVLPWSAIAFLTAFLTTTKREALLLGGILGFVASYSYLWFDHTSKLTLSQTIVLLLIIILPSFFGLLCGVACSWLGWLTRTHVVKTS